ncbi:MAG: alpha-galactosidase [bacterium]
MKKIIATAVLLLSLFSACAFAGAESGPAEKWLDANFAKGANPPFSFTYDGRNSNGFLKNWDYGRQDGQLDAVRAKRIYTYTDPKTKLQIRAECILYKDFQAVEWVLRIRNNAAETSPLIEDIQALDTVFKNATSSYVLLHHALGGAITSEDFAPVETPIRTAETLRISPNGGRSSDITSLPFFNLEARPGGGVMMAIGWSGQWAATFNRLDDSAARARAGMALTHLKLYANEEIRTPRILLMFWDGPDYMKGQNMFRKMILTHYSPQAGGKTVTLPLSFSVHGTYVFNDTTEKNMVELAAIAADKFKNIGFEYFWIDAGWFKGGWSNGVGNIFPDPIRYPNGLAPVGKAAAANGFKFLLWVEPERVYYGAQLDTEHPKWVLRTFASLGNGLLNLGNEKARRWLTDTVSGLIETAGISIYRQDFNMDPIKIWHYADSPMRQGMTEIRHIEGMYEYWDELVRRHPGLIIDNCASGGRRIDLETVSRSVALWRTDYADIRNPLMATGFQSQTYGLGFWLPTTSTGTSTLDKYDFRSAMNNGIVISWNPTKPDFPFQQAETLAAEFKRARMFYFGDYYPLTGYSIAEDVWMAYQFHRDDMRAGIVLAFRRKDNQDPQLSVKLRGLSPDAEYELDYSGTNIKLVATGKELMNSLIITLDAPRDSALIFYKQK